MQKSHPLAQYEDFSRRELPRRVRSRLTEVVEERTYVLEEELVNDLVDIVRRCQEDVYHTFTSTIGGTSPQQPEESQTNLSGTVQNTAPAEEVEGDALENSRQPEGSPSYDDFSWPADDLFDQAAWNDNIFSDYGSRNG